MKLKKLSHKNRKCNKIFITPPSYRFHAGIERPEWMSSLVGSPGVFMSSYISSTTKSTGTKKFLIFTRIFSAIPTG
jgi:hypothetical protein